MTRANGTKLRNLRIVHRTSDVVPGVQSGHAGGPAGRAVCGSRGLERLAWWLDSAIPIPGTRLRIGLDGLIGLVPGIGDVIGTVLSGYLIAQSARLGVPASTLARMVLNVAVETLVGAIPVLGDLFDFVWKANRRNVDLLQAYERDPKRVTRRNRLVVAAVVAGALAVLVAVAGAAFAIVGWLWITATAGA
jgi:hypothetical protein